MVDLVVRVPSSFAVDRDPHGRQSMRVACNDIDRAIKDLRKILDELVRISNVRADT